MTSQKQIEANRLNAQKSTGPKTTPGKEKTRLNAVKHGLTAKINLLPGESAEQFEDFIVEIIHYLWPQTPLERFLAEQIALDCWRLKRAGRAEVGLIAVGMIDAAGTPNEIELYRLNCNGKLPVDESVLRLGDAFWRVAAQRGDALAKLSRHETQLFNRIVRMMKEFKMMRASMPPTREFDIEADSIYEAPSEDPLDSEEQAC